MIEEANKINRPIIVISNNKPQGAIIDLDLLDRLQLGLLVKEALKEYKTGKTKKIPTEKELEKDLRELEKYA